MEVSDVIEAAQMFRVLQSSDGHPNPRQETKEALGSIVPTKGRTELLQSVS